MTINDKIRALVAIGSSLRAVEAEIGRKLTEAEKQLFYRVRNARDVREYQRKAAKKAAVQHDDAARKRQLRDAVVSIDNQLAEARAKIDWARRTAAEKSLEAWIRTYGIGVFINDPPPSPHGSKILREMDEANKSARPYQILVGRGGGKTSYAEANDLKCVATGESKLMVISGANALAAQQIKHEIDAAVFSEPFATDYPDVSLPFQLLNGHGRRSQTYGGKPTACRMTATVTQFAKLVEKDGTEAPTSGSALVAKPLKSVRGTKIGTIRPDGVHLDDLQTREIARNPDRVDEILHLIRGDVMGLAGKKRISVTFTATTICEGDVTQKLKADPAWKTTENKSVVTWPDEWAKPNHGLWGEYFDLFDADNALDRPHDHPDGSMTFYMEHRDVMKAGADILNWGYFDENRCQVDGLQKLMDDYHTMGHADFMAEHQMEPQSQSFSIEITPKLIMSRVRKGVPPLALPPETVLTVAATDINPSYGITTAVTAFDVNLTAQVIAYKVRPCKIDGRLNSVEFTRRVEEELTAHGREVARLGVRLDRWGIDAGGRQFDAVTHFTANGCGGCGVEALPMLGRAGQNWNPAVKSRVRAAVNDTVLCRDVRGRRWLAWNADAYKEKMHLAWGTEVGATGGLSLFDGGVNHSRFATQIANERLVEKLKSKHPMADGTERWVYRWRTREPHDFGDAMAMCYALAASCNLSGDGTVKTSKHKRRTYNG